MSFDSDVALVARELMAARRPLIIFGAGVKEPNLANGVLGTLNVPLLVTWGARATFPRGIDFGTHGGRAGNLAVQCADYVLTVGTRLDTKATGSPASTFAPCAKLVMVDIDPGEVLKMFDIGRPLHRYFVNDAGDFLLALKRAIVTEAAVNSARSISDWVWRIAEWRRDYPAPDTLPYDVVRELSELSQPDDVIVSDTGCVVAWMMQAFVFKGQKFIHAFNNTPMGYGVPAAVGAAFATGRRVILVTGDGGLGVNLNEFATIVKHDLNVKIILFNNKGHAMCRQTQDQWLGGQHDGTSGGGGLAIPEYYNIADAYGINCYGDSIIAALAVVCPAFCEIRVDYHARVEPMVRFGKSLECADPLVKDLKQILSDARAL